MTQHFSDRQIQVIKIGLETLRQIKQDQCTNVTPKQPINEFDIIQSEHTLMESMALLSRLTGKPVSYFANPHPSQTPTVTEPRMETGGQGQTPLAAPSHAG